MNEGDLFAILIGGDPFQLVLTLWKGDLEIALGMATRPATTAATATAMAICALSEMWPGYESDSDDDKELLAPWKSYFGDEPLWKKCFDESFKTGACDYCRKGVTATIDGPAYNAMLLPPTAPEYGKYDSQCSLYYHLPASSESIPASDGKKSGLSTAERRRK